MERLNQILEHVKTLRDHQYIHVLWDKNINTPSYGVAHIDNRSYHTPILDKKVYDFLFSDKIQNKTRTAFIARLTYYIENKCLPYDHEDAHIYITYTPPIINKSYYFRTLLEYLKKDKRRYEHCLWEENYHECVFPISLYDLNHEYYISKPSGFSINSREWEWFFGSQWKNDKNELIHRIEVFLKYGVPSLYNPVRKFKLDDIEYVMTMMNKKVTVMKV